MIKTAAEILVEHPFFRDLSQPYLELIAGCASNAHYQTGDFLFREGEDADRFFIIRDGQVALDMYDPRKGALTIDTAEPGEVLGFSWLFPPHRWLFDARVVSDARLTELDGKCLRGKCDADPALGYELMKRFASIIIDRLQSTRVRLSDIYVVGQSSSINNA